MIMDPVGIRKFAKNKSIVFTSFSPHQPCFENIKYLLLLKNIRTMMKQSEEFETYSKTIGGQQHFERKVEAKGNKIKTMFTSRINFKSSQLDVIPPNLFRWRGYGNWFQVPNCLEYYTERNGAEYILFNNGGVRQTRP